MHKILIGLFAVLWAAWFLAPDLGLAGRVGLARTGQTLSDATGDDAETHSGVSWPVPRFTVNADGTVRDNLTGLMWLQDSECLGRQGLLEWRYDGTGTDYALGSGGRIEALNLGNVPNCINYQAGTYDDWRMPNIREMLSLITYYAVYPAIPDTQGTDKMRIWGQPFYLQPENEPRYWTSTTFVDDVSFNQDNAYYVNIVTGEVSRTSKSGNLFQVWPVRGRASGAGVVIPLP